MDFGYYFGIFLRRLPWIILFTALGTAAGLALALTLPPSYTSNAELVVDSEQIPEDMASSTVRTGEIEALQIIRQRILTRNNLLEIANEFEIYEGEDDLTPDGKVDDMRSRTSFEIEGGDAPRGSTSATIVHLSFRAETAQQASAVANRLVTMTLQENEQMRTEAANETLRFFDQEVEDLQQQLSDVSSDILQFKEDNLKALPDSLEFRRSRQAALQERLVQLERERTSLLDRRERLKTMFEQTGEITMTGSGSQMQAAPSPQEQRLQELRDEYTELSAVLSDTNPRITALQSQIDSVEASIEASAADSSEGDGSGSGEEEEASASGNSRQATLYDVQVADINAQIEYIETQRETIEQQMQDLQESIEATPGNTVTLESLQRKQSNLQTQYNQAVANRAQAEQGSLIESLSRGRRISVVEQAVPPDSPTSPNRPIVAAAGVGGGLFLGIAVLLLLELLNSSIRRPQDIRSALGVDVLATIPYIQSPGELRRRRTRLAAVVLIIIVGIPAAAWYVDQQVTPLEPLVGDLVSRINPA